MRRLLGDWRSRGPAYDALAQRVRILIREGQLSPDTRVPPERALAEQLGISRTTVTKAYDMLRAEGRLRSARGSGTVIALPEPAADGPETTSPGPAAAEWCRPATDWAADFASDRLPVPDERIGQALGSIAPAVARAFADRSHEPYGLPELRQAVADRYTERGLPTSPAQILITQGVRHSWQLMLRLRARPAQRVLIESPAAPHVMDAIWLHGARPWPVGLGANGWHIELFSAAMHQARPQLALLTPDFQHPTGHVMSSEERHLLVRTALRTGTLLVSDESAVDLRLDDGGLPESLAAHAPDTTVALIDSARAAIGDGVRVGWIRTATSTVHRLAVINSALGTTGSVPDQVVAARLMASADGLLAERRAALRAGRATLTAALRQHLPHWRFAIPRGGTTLWADLGAPVSSALTTAAERHRVHLLSGPRFGTGGTYDSRLRLPFTLDEHSLRNGVRRLALAWEDVMETAWAGAAERPEAIRSPAFT
ncbi:PLP-dependent aminotransferase family protein [Streptomyces olivoreticuli]|uniref:aminotransferase-like domain-containing protein n=1 Tax=Streptomyces olivoreticuli TaxID=68246 RepID=UPI0026587EEF|nr:PLP-dependent aminotransferase family protein [Streptomyces olivoreticuli]WKK26790.1 PLP-dependent aminotransferase family protein [Streptomyces olivoreticuli]